MLDSSKAHQKLNWQPVLSIDEQIRMTAEWYDQYHENKAVISREQLSAYENAASKSKAAWA
jgi:dTDP-D-glucose 4,6-dehydratase